MELPILKDKNIFPTNEVLADVLEASFPAFEAFSASAEAAGLTLEWNYYNDGKAWLCKVLSKKKNLAWLVVYQNYFRTTSYFTEKHLDISPTWKLRKASKRNSTGRNPVVNSSL